MEERDLKEITRNMRSDYPAPSEVYDDIANVLEALWAQNVDLRAQVESLAAAIRAQGSKT